MFLYVLFFFSLLLLVDAAHNEQPDRGAQLSCRVDAKHAVVSCKLEEERVVEKLGHVDVFAQALAAACLEHKVAREVLGGRGFERSQDDGLVQGIAGHDLKKKGGKKDEDKGIKKNILVYLPVIKQLLAKGLTLCVCAEIRLKAKRVDHGEERFDSVQGGACLGRILGDVPTTVGEDSVHGRHAVCWRLDFDKVDWLHQARGGLV